MSASWFFGVNIFDLDLGVQIDSIEQPIKSNSVGLETCLIVRLLPFMIILMTASLSSNTYNKTSDAKIGRLREQHQCLSSHRFSCEACDVCEHHTQVSLIHLKHEKHFHEQKRLDPIVPEQAHHPISVQCPKR